jgi:hypothetical protein
VVGVAQTVGKGMRWGQCKRQPVRGASVEEL